MLASCLPDMLFWNPWLDAYFKWINSFAETEPQYKHGYLQHPSEIPLSATVKDQEPLAQSAQGKDTNGLCFATSDNFAVGSALEINIVLNGSAFNADAKVTWVETEGDTHWIGVKFNDPESAYSMRMAEQICHIEHYRQDVLATQGRNLSQEQAAIEWVERYAADFPASI